MRNSKRNWAERDFPTYLMGEFLKTQVTGLSKNVGEHLLSFFCNLHFVHRARLAIWQKITAACGIFQSDSALSKSSSSATLLFHCCSSGRRGPAPAVLLMVVVGAARRLAWPCCCCYRKLCVTPIVLPCHCHALTQCQRTHNALGNQRMEEMCEWALSGGRCIRKPSHSIITTSPCYFYHSIFTTLFHKHTMYWTTLEGC